MNHSIIPNTASRATSIAVVLEGGSVQTIIVQDWPTPIPLPHVVIVDYDDDEVAESERTTFTIGGTRVDALCHAQIPDVYEAFRIPALSPKAVLAALDEHLGGKSGSEASLRSIAASA